MADCRFNDDCCDNCETDYYRLIDLLVKDIQHLEAKVVYLRYSLSNFLSGYDGEMLRCEIFSDLSGGYTDEPAFQRYVAAYCGGQDPMESEEYNDHISKLALGEKSIAL